MIPFEPPKRRKDTMTPDELIEAALYDNKADPTLDAFTRRAMLLQAVADTLWTVAINMTTLRSHAQNEKIWEAEEDLCDFERKSDSLHPIVRERLRSMYRAKQDVVLAGVNNQCHASICRMWASTEDAMRAAAQAWEDAVIEQKARNQPVG